MAEEQEIYVFELKQGDTKRFYVTKIDADFTNYTAKLQLRKKPGDDAVLSLTQSSGLTISLVVEGGINKARIAVLITDEQSAAIEPGIYHGDLFVYSPAGEGIHLVEIQVIVKARYTQ